MTQRAAVSAPRLMRRSAGPQAVERSAGGSLRALAPWLAAALVFGTGAFSLYVTQVSALASAGYDLARLQVERAGWLARNEQLELELAKRRSLAWTEVQAVQRLGMVRSGPPVFVPVQAQPQDGHLVSDPSPSAAPDRPSRTAPTTGRREPGDLARLFDTLTAWLLDAPGDLP